MTGFEAQTKTPGICRGCFSDGLLRRFAPRKNLILLVPAGLASVAEFLRSLHQALLARGFDLGRSARVRHPVELRGGQSLGRVLLTTAIALLFVSGQRRAVLFREGGVDGSSGRRSDLASLSERNCAVLATVRSKAS